MARLWRNMLTRRRHDRHLAAALERHARGRLIDIGCGDKPYRALLARYVDEHVGVDHDASLHDTSRADVTGSAYEIPHDDATFDTVLCTAVLEHLEEPEAGLRESLRVLKPGGHAIYTVPFIWHLHESPRDFYRYSRHGLEYLFHKVGYELETIEALSGFWVTFGQLLVYNLHRYHRGPLRWIPVVPLLGLLIQGLAALLDTIDRSEQWTWMYLVVARRPVRSRLIEPKPAPVVQPQEFMLHV